MSIDESLFYAAMQRQQQLSFEELVRFPIIEEDPGSVRPIEKVLIGNFMLLIRPKIILELGVWKAKTTRFFYDFARLNGINARIVGFDVPTIVTRLREENPSVGEMENSGTVELVPGFLPETLSQWLKENTIPVDLVLIDARHDYPSVMSELVRLWPRLSPGGVILCHDYNAIGTSDEGTSYAVERFAKRRRNAHIMWLGSSKVALDYVPKKGQEYLYTSALVGLRLRPFKPAFHRLLHHLWQETRWQLNRLKTATKRRLKGKFPS